MFTDNRFPAVLIKKKKNHILNRFKFQISLVHIFPYYPRKTLYFILLLKKDFAAIKLN